MKFSPLSVKRRKLFETLGLSAKAMSLLAWLLAFLWLLLELKQHYHIDVLPGIDSPVDDFYGFLRATVRHWFS